MCTHAAAAADKVFVSDQRTEREREPLTRQLIPISQLDRVRLQILYTCHTSRIVVVAAVFSSFQRRTRSG